jgi:branched-chain amino acid transport system permease protein
MMASLASYGAFFLTTALTYALICLGLNLQWGQTGLFNVGVAGFVAIGAYASALLTTPPSEAHLMGWNWPIAAGWIGAMLASGAASALIGFVTSRLRSDYLAIATFGVAVTIQLIALNAQALTGGPYGIAFIPRPFADLADRPLLFNGLNLLVIAALVGVVYVALERLSRGPWGRVWRGIRAAERAAASLGKSPNFYRLQAFALGGAIMGLGGAAQAHFIGFIAPDNYLSSLTFLVWTMLILGGAGNNLGATLGGVLVWALWSASSVAISALFPAGWQARASALQIVAVGIVLSLVLLLRPRGLIGERAIVSRHLDE